MIARWASFAVGLWLVFAPLLLGYDLVTAVLHDVAVGLLVCVAALAALEWPAARFAQLVPAAWLVQAERTLGLDSPSVAANQLAAAAALAVLALFPSSRILRRAAEPVEAAAGSRAA